MRAVNTLLFVGAIAFTFTWGLQWARAPWSFAFLGPTLTGLWDGPMRAQQGAEYRVFLDLRYAGMNGGSSPVSTLVGQARICTRQGEMFDYKVEGDASRSGDSITLGLTSADPDHGDLNTTLDGGWDGETLTVRSLSNPFMPDGTLQPPNTASTPATDDEFSPATLHKADPVSFMVACGRLAG